MFTYELVDLFEVKHSLFMSTLEVDVVSLLKNTLPRDIYIYIHTHTNKL
jgi:hypothetical protein